MVNLSNVKAVWWTDRTEMPVNPWLGRCSCSFFTLSAYLCEQVIVSLVRQRSGVLVHKG